VPVIYESIKKVGEKMKPASLVGLALAVFAIASLLTSPLLPVRGLGSGFSESSVITVRLGGLQEDEVIEGIRGATGAEPKIVARSDGMLVVEVEKPLSDGLRQSIEQALAGAEEISVLPASPEFSLGTVQVLSVCLTSFLLVGIITSIVSRRRRALFVFPMVCLLTLLETVAVLMFFLPVSTEMILTSLLPPITLVVVSSGFLLSPVRQDEGPKRIRTALTVFLAGLLSAILAFVVLHVASGLVLVPIASSAVGALVGGINVIWLTGDLLVQPTAKEVILQHVSF
jgi:hypothetical protein